MLALLGNLLKHRRKWGKLSKNPRSEDQEMCTSNTSACEGVGQNPAQP